MPELVARSDQAVTAPRRRPARSKAKSKRAARRRYLPAFILARPGRTAACAVVAAILTGIVLNAAFFQKGRHPAPLFATAPTVQPRAAHVARVPVPVPVPAPRSGEPAPSSPEELTPPAAITSPSPAHAAVPVPPPRTMPAKAEAGDARRDAIGAFLKGEGGAVSPDRVTAAQKALMHVGYVLRADGILGGGTRKVIEQFQRDNDLSVTGELNARTLRELTAQSGVVIP